MNADVATIARVYGELAVVSAEDPDAVVEHNVNALREHGLNVVANSPVRRALAADPALFVAVYVGAMLRHLLLDGVVLWVEDHDLAVVPYLKLRVGGAPFTVALPVRYDRAEAVGAAQRWSERLRFLLSFGGALRVTVIDLTFLRLERAPWRR